MRLPEKIFVLLRQHLNLTGDGYTRVKTENRVMNADSVFIEFPQLETESLILREIRPSDAEAIFHIYADDDVTQYLDSETATSLEQAKFIIRRRAELFKNKQRVRWGIARKDNNVIIGSCGYAQWIQNASRAEIGYELAKAYWRKGIMTEALTAIIKFGFQKMKLNRIEAMTMVENKTSAKVLKKLGFLEEGILREYGFWKEQFHDLKLFSLLNKDYSNTIV
jgi:ribosomal-protein-alanine N-acetyltransferase